MRVLYRIDTDKHTFINRLNRVCLWRFFAVLSYAILLLRLFIIGLLVARIWSIIYSTKGRVDYMVAIYVFIAIVVAAALYYLKLVTTDEKKQIDNIPHDELMRYKVLDEVNRKFRELAQSGEVSYFSLDDVNKIIDELKDNK